MSRHLTTSITALADATKLISQGDLKNKVDVSSNDELGDAAKDIGEVNVNSNRVLEESELVNKNSEELKKIASDLQELRTADEIS